MQHKPATENKVNIDLGKIFTGKEIYFVIATLALCSFIVFRDFITGEKIFLYKDIGSDSVNILYPSLMQMSDYIKNFGVPTWSFEQGMGQNMFPLWLGDIFSNLLTILFSKEKIPYLLGTVEAIKIVLCGVVFYKYLLELKVSKFAAYTGSLLFAFCGFIVLGSCWTIFSVEALYVATILYGFERWLNHGKIFWLVSGITALAFLQPFLLFPYTLFLAAYISTRYNDERGDQWQKFPLFVAKTIGLAILGVAISCYQLIPDVLQYIESPRVGGEAALTDKLKAQPIFGITDSLLRFTTTFRAFGSDMLGTGSEFKGWQNYLEAPLFYCGILCLVTFPQAFVSFTKRQRIGWGITAGLFLLPILFPYFRYTFWAYSGDYFRAYSLVVVLLMLFLTVRGLDNILRNGKVNLAVLGASIVFYLFLLYTPATEFEEFVNQGARSGATILLLLYGGTLWALTRPAHIKHLAMGGITLFIISEAILFSSTTVNERETITAKEWQERAGYNDHTTDVVNYLKQTDKGFFRLNKSYTSGPAVHTSFNDAKAQGYYGTMSYHSFNQINYVRFLGGMGVIDPKDEFQTRWIKGLSERPLLMSLTSCKYWLTKKPEGYLKPFGYDSVKQFGDVYLFKNTHSVPLGIGYSTAISEQAFRALSPGQKDLFLLRGFVYDSADASIGNQYTAFNPADTAQPFTLEAYFGEAAKLSTDSLTITQFRENNIIGTTNYTSNKMLFLSIPFDAGWHATVDGKDARIQRINIGFSGIQVAAGKHTIELKYIPRYMKEGGIITATSIIAFISLLALSIRKRNALS